MSYCCRMYNCADTFNSSLLSVCSGRAEPCKVEGESEHPSQPLDGLHLDGRGEAGHISDGGNKSVGANSGRNKNGTDSDGGTRHGAVRLSVSATVIYLLVVFGVGSCFVMHRQSQTPVQDFSGSPVQTPSSSQEDTHMERDFFTMILSGKVDGHRQAETGIQEVSVQDMDL
ncbi:hypothetical protein EXN66_Car014000 [Channa argus]|uniref:Uncharacterized protein n=1 Tax=Channa argus TaxID=215402 RepID=A0A6G1Q7C0_CHAAH|nr:hypothetical protein EXN66_Car014000 [Channa argus]